jgi:hypothetical protein
VSVAGAMPEPLRLTVCGLLLAESVTVTVPLYVPSATGWEDADTVQLAPAPRVAGALGHVVELMKPAEIAIVEIASGPT